MTTATSPFPPARFCTHYLFALGAIGFLTSAPLARAIILLPNPTTYAQNFDSLGTATLAWIDDSTVPGWIAGINANLTPDGNLQATDGSGTTALSGLLHLGSAGAGDRALGSKNTGTGFFANIAYGVVFQNTSSQPLVVTNITYTGELWRTNSTAAGQAEQWFFFYKTSSSAITDVEPGQSSGSANAGSFTPFATIDWSSPTNLPANSALDGNNPANRLTRSGNPSVTINPGEYFMARWVDTNSPGTDGYQGIDNVSITFSPAPQIVSAISRKVHNGMAFDIGLPRTGPLGVECRSGGPTGDYQVVITFVNSVSVTGTPQAGVTTGIGDIGTSGASNGGAVSVSGAVVTVPLTNVFNPQRIVITLFGVNDGISTASLAIPMGVLVGDSNSDAAVNSGDAIQTRSRSGQPADAINFRSDFNVDGIINSGDATIARARSGTAVP